MKFIVRKLAQDERHAKLGEMIPLFTGADREAGHRRRKGILKGRGQKSERYALLFTLHFFVVSPGLRPIAAAAHAAPLARAITAGIVE